MHAPSSSGVDVRAFQTHLRALRAELSDLPATQREEAVDDVRAHVTDAVEAGRPLAQVLADLGPASRYREELGLPPRSDGSPLRSARALQAGAAVVAVLTAAFVVQLHVLPAVRWQGTDRPPTDGLPPGLVSASVVAIVTAVVAVAAAVLLVLPRGLAAGEGEQLRTPGRVVSATFAVLLTAASVIDVDGDGLWWFPAALLAWAAVVVPQRLGRAPSERGAAVRRWLRASFVLLPVVLVTVATAAPSGVGFPSGRDALVLFGVVGALTAVGVLVGRGSRAGHVALALGGVLVMVTGVLDGGLLLMAVWWMGGLWLLLGVVGLVDGTARSRRRTGPRAPALG